MMRRIVLGLMPILLFLDHALAGCGADSCPLRIHDPVSAGLFRTTAAFEYIDQNSIFVGSEKSFVGAIPGDHDEVRTINRLLLLRAVYGINQSIGITLDVPIVNRHHTHIENESHHGGLLNGGRLQGLNGVTHGDEGLRTWDINGLGDMVVTGQYALLNTGDPDDVYLALSAGLKLPTGKTDAVNTDGAEAEVTIQPGTGSYDGLFSADFIYPILTAPGLDDLYSTIPLQLSVLYRLNGEGTQGYRFGNLWVTTVGSRYRVNDLATFLVQVNGRFQGFHDVGQTGEPRENTGGTWIFASPGVALNLTGAISLVTFAQFPVYQNVNGIQQTSEMNLRVAIEAALD